MTSADWFEFVAGTRQTGVELFFMGGPNNTPAIISYGPWAERQRDLIMKYMFPPDFQDQEVCLRVCVCVCACERACVSVSVSVCFICALLNML